MKNLIGFVMMLILAMLFFAVCIYIEKSGIENWLGINDRYESTKLELIANFDGLLVYADRMGGYEVRE